jgi:predicted nucleotidyltransferase
MLEDWLSKLCSWSNANDNVRELWLFGSRAQGSSRSDSDVDLALALVPSVKKNDDLAYTNYFFSKDEWKRQLEEIVGRHVAPKSSRQTCRTPIGILWCDASGFAYGAA